MPALIPAKNEMPEPLAFNMLGMPPSKKRILHEQEQAHSQIKTYELFLKRVLIVSAFILFAFASTATFLGFDLVISISVILLMCIFAALTANGAPESSILFLVLAYVITGIAFRNQHIGIMAAVFIGLTCASLPYFFLHALQTKKNLAKEKIAELTPADDEKVQTFHSWARVYPACNHYLDQVLKMQRPLVLAEYEAGLDLVLELNKQYVRGHYKGFNFAPFFL